MIYFFGDAPREVEGKSDNQQAFLESVMKVSRIVELLLYLDFVGDKNLLSASAFEMETCLYIDFLNFIGLDYTVSSLSIGSL